jgi:hypothetical protein
MAETVNIPGIGEIKTTYLVVGLAAAGGFVAFMWLRRKDSGVPDMIPVIDPSQIPPGEYVPPGGTPATGHQDLTGDNITTNDQWYRKALDYLADRGWDTGALGVALGNFLDRRALTPTQIEMVLAAKGAFGDPPVGGPWEVKPGLPNAPTQSLPKPGNLRTTGATRNSISLAWDAVPGATGYQVEWEGETGKFHTRFDRTSSTTYTVSDMPLPDEDYQLNVRATDGVRHGETASLTARTTK